MTVFYSVIPTYYSRWSQVYGLDQEWLGGDMANGPGGGHKINILRKALQKYKDDQNLIVMFTDRYQYIL